jgi:myo-inositol-1(or 4)-monophosphatase
LPATNDPDLANRRAVAEAACRAAAAVHLTYREPAIAFETKHGNPRDLVTIADTQAQAAAVAVIEAAFPGETIIGEEDSPSPERMREALGDRCWLIDPLDGTFNYVHGFPDFSATVAFVDAGRPIVGATYAPIFDEMFSAATGLGCSLNGQPVSVSTRKGLAGSVVNVWLGRPAGDPEQLASMGRLQAHALSQKVFGGTAIVMAYLACGRFDVFYVADNPRMGDWDIAAGAVLIEEAGGIVTHTSGGPLRLPSSNVAAAADPATLEELRGLLAGE